MQYRNEIGRFFFVFLVVYLTGCDLSVRQVGSEDPIESRSASRSEAESQSGASIFGGGQNRGIERTVLSDLHKHNDYRFSFELETLDGRNVSDDSFRGQVLVVDLWATWCPPCRQEVPHFVDLQERYRDQGLAVLGLNYERTFTAAGAHREIAQFTARQPVNYPLALGTPELKSQVPGFRGYPTTLFIDRQGMVRATVTGTRPLAYLETMVKTLLFEGSPGGSSSAARPSSVAAERAVAELAPAMPKPQGAAKIQRNPYAL